LIQQGQEEPPGPDQKSSQKNKYINPLVPNQHQSVALLCQFLVAVWLSRMARPFGLAVWLGPMARRMAKPYS